MKKWILGSEDFTPGAAHFGPLNLDLFPPDGDGHSLIILIISPIIVIHAPSHFILRLFIGFGRLVAELELLVQMCRSLVLGVLLEARSKYHLADVLMLRHLKIWFLGGFSQHLGQEGSLLAGVVGFLCQRLQVVWIVWSLVVLVRRLGFNEVENVMGCCFEHLHKFINHLYLL